MLALPWRSPADRQLAVASTFGPVAAEDGRPTRYFRTYGQAVLSVHERHSRLLLASGESRVVRAKPSRASEIARDLRPAACGIQTVGRVC